MINNNDILYAVNEINKYLDSEGITDTNTVVEARVNSEVSAHPYYSIEEIIESVLRRFYY